MSNLITKPQEIKIGADNVLAINARDLHKALGIKKKFADWVKVYITKFIENQDWVVFPFKGKNPTGGRPRADYAFSLDMAKHVAMMSETAKGMEIRQRYIELEKEYIRSLKQSLNVKRARHQAASSYKLMADILKMTRESLGKESKPYHYANEARLVNQVLTGQFKRLDRDQLSYQELAQLALLEEKNTLLIAAGTSYQARKLALQRDYKLLTSHFH